MAMMPRRQMNYGGQKGETPPMGGGLPRKPLAPPQGVPLASPQIPPTTLTGDPNDPISAANIGAYGSSSAQGGQMSPMGGAPMTGEDPLQELLQALGGGGKRQVRNGYGGAV